MESINKPSYLKAKHKLKSKLPSKKYLGQCICSGIIFMFNSKEICSNCSDPRKKFNNN